MKKTSHILQTTRYLGLGAAMVLAITASAVRADFSGTYSPASWTLANTNANGSVNITGAPASIVLTGGNNGSGVSGETDYTHSAPATGLVSFNWSYTNSPDTANDDPAGYLLNGIFTALAGRSGDPASGTASFSVTQGNTFGFAVQTIDNQIAAGRFTISSFSAPIAAVPEASTFLLIAFGLVMLWLGKRRGGVAKAGMSLLILTVLVLGHGSVFAQGTRSANVAQRLPATVISVKTVDVGALAKIPAPAGSVSDAFDMDSLHHSPLAPPFAPRGPHNYSHLRSASLATQSAPVAPLNFLGWTGLTHLDSRNSNGGNQFSIEPPDQALAVGHGKVFEAINDAVNVYNLNGVQQLARPLSINEFFGLAPAINRTTNVRGPSLGDPVAFFDATVGASGRFFFATYGQTTTNNVAAQQSQIYLAVSQTSDPAGLWNIYTIDATNASNADGMGPRFPDYPHMAADAYGVYISVNEFHINSGGGLDFFIDAAIYALSKASLVAGGTTPPVYRIPVPYSCNLNTGVCQDPDNSAFEFTIYPAIVPPGASFFLGNGGGQYFVSSDSDNNTGTSMAVWALTNTSSLNTASASLALTKVKVPSQTYNFPTVGGQTQKEGFRPLGLSLTNPGNPDTYPNPPAALPTISAGDDRVQNVNYAAGRLWVTLSSEVLDSHGNPHTGAAYFVFAPSNHSGNLNAIILAQGTLMLDDTNLTRSAVAVNPNNTGAMVFTLHGLNDYPSCAFVPINDLTVGAITIARAGTVPEDGFTGYPAVGGGNGTSRWGDYSAAMVGADGSIFMATEYCPDINRTINANWCTYVMHYFPQ